jgi:hypothetical protein
MVGCRQKKGPGRVVCNQLTEEGSCHSGADDFIAHLLSAAEVFSSRTNTANGLRLRKGWGKNTE